MHKLAFFALCLFVVISSAIRWGSDSDSSHREERNVCDISQLSELLRRDASPPPSGRPYGLVRRQSSGGDGSGDSVGVELGNTTVRAKLGNINITVQNVTISTGKIEVEDITIGNITVLVNVNLAELGKLLPLGNLTLPQLPSVSLPITLPTLAAASTTVTGTSIETTVTPSATTSTGGADVDRIRREATSVVLGKRQTTVPPLPSASVDIGTGDILVDAEIGNITLSVENINVTVGDVTLKNISVGNVLVLVNLGTQNDLTNLTNLVAK